MLGRFSIIGRFWRWARARAAHQVYAPMSIGLKLVGTRQSIEILQVPIPPRNIGSLIITA